MGFGVDLDRDKPAPAASSAPALTYQATDGIEVPVDERAPARGLLLHALALLDAADRP